MIEIENIRMMAKLTYPKDRKKQKEYIAKEVAKISPVEVLENYECLIHKKNWYKILINKNVSYTRYSIPEIGHEQILTTSFAKRTRVRETDFLITWLLKFGT